MQSLAIVLLVASLAVSGCKTSHVESERAYETAIILGAWSWNVASNQLCAQEDGDFWWERATADAGYLVPLNGAKAALVKGRDFGRIDGEYVRRAALSSERIESGTLKPGTILIFRTGRGREGKLQVIGYKALHDFDFPEAVYLIKAWRDLVLTRPDVPDFHLQIRWALLN